MGGEVFVHLFAYYLNERFWGCLKSHATIPLLNLRLPEPKVPDDAAAASDGDARPGVARRDGARRPWLITWAPYFHETCRVC